MGVSVGGASHPKEEIAAAEGLQLVEERDDLRVALSQVQHGIHGQGGHELFIRQPLTRETVDALAECLEIGQRQAHAAGHGVSAAGD